jgi:hypothetical protein
MLSLFLGQILPFIRKYWRVLLIASMVLVIYLQNASHNATKREFALFKDETVKAANIYAESMRIKDEIYINQRDKVLAERDAKYKALNLDRDKIRKALNEKVNSSDSLHDTLRVLQDRSHSAETEQSGNYQEPPKAERDCDSTITQLIQAGKSCALDYESIYNDVKSYEDSHNAGTE